MKKITLKTLLFMCLSVVMSTVTAQDASKAKANDHDPNHRNCGLDQHYAEMEKNPAYAASYYELKAKVDVRIAEIHEQKMNGKYQMPGPYIIPVAVHFPDSDEADRACLEAFAQTQIDVITNDYAGTNADQAPNWPAASAFYPGLVPGTVDVQFCIATKNHPATGDPEVTEGNPLVTIGANGSNFGNWPEADARYAGYMNFIIKDAGAGILGYSPLGGSIAAGNAVVMSYTSYGTGAGCIGSNGTPDVIPSSTYNLGRTVTHELGHFYTLNHTFMADSQQPGYVYNCTGADGDGYADTPKVSGSTYGTPANGSVAGCVAGTFSLTMNYMDYVNDSAMYMFTPDQATAVEAYFDSVAGDWNTNVLECVGPVISFGSSTLSIDEGTDCTYTDILIPVNIAGVPNVTATVDVTVTGGTANGADYLLMNNTGLSFVANANAPENITLRLYNDGFVESSETIVLTIR